MSPRMTIIGTGLVGTSIGLGLKKSKPNYEIVGHDKDPGAASKAKKLGAVDKTAWNLINAIEGAGLVILALPLDAIKPTLEAIAPYLAQGCVVTDTASAKRQVLTWAEAILPPGVHFVGGHPLLTAEGQGPESATAALLDGATYCLTPTPETNPEAVELLTGLAATLGASPYFLDAVEHDNFMAAVGYLPLLMAASLMNLAANSPSHRELRKLSGGDFRHATALSETNAAATAQICVANSEAVLRCLDAYVNELGRLRGLIAAGGPELQSDLQKAAEARALWLSRADDEESEAMRVASESTGDLMRHMFVGNLGRRRGK